MVRATRVLAYAIFLVFTSNLLLPNAVEEAEAAPSRLPNSMASVGDSITRAFNVCCWPFIDNPQKSWSTGDGSNDGITSHYEKIVKKNRNINGKNYNDGRSGAKMADLQGQVTTATGRNVEYLTLLMGANDVCTSTIAGMTPVETFRSQFRAAADVIKARAPGTVVYVVSIPNVYRLWEVGVTSSSARNAWSAYGICQSMLSTSNTEADRQAVLQRNVDFNTVLQQEAANYGFYWDNNAVFNYPFQLNQLSSYDYFHPNVNGQNTLASVTWSAGPYAGMA